MNSPLRKTQIKIRKSANTSFELRVRIFLSFFISIGFSMNTQNHILVFSGNANKPLAGQIAQKLNVELGLSLISKFSDGETRIEIQSSVRGKDVFLIQSTCAPANENIMELLIMLDAMKRASPYRITAVIPYYGYSRQERKSAPRTPITAKLIADLLSTAGIDRLLTLELHTGAIQGFFDIPVDHLYSKPVFFENFKKMNFTNPVIVSPDAGGTERARAMAKLMGCGLVIIDKRREKPNESEVMHIVGEVENKTAIIIDDIVDTAGSLTTAAKTLKAHGALKVYAAATHGVLSGPAIERIQNSCMEKLFITDTISLSHAALSCEKIKVLSVADILAKGIHCIHNNESISRLFI